MKAARLRCACFTLALLFLRAAPPAAAQNFRAFTRLSVISTARFDIIFPPESEATARRLARTADASYERISGLLGITVKGKIPVTISPHMEQFNGFMNPLPYPHIMLYDTPSDPEWTVFEDSLEGLFFHELTHAVSLNSRSGLWNLFHDLFGGWASPTGLTAPAFMVEGVTVSFESLDGFGRANDPLTKEQLAQEIHEGAFLTPFQVSGGRDLPAQVSYYEYGGLFNTWLQKTYGMEKYAELWQAMGGPYHFSFIFYNNGFYHAFKKVYGIPFLDAWSAFKDAYAPGPLKENRAGFIRSNFRNLSKRSAGAYPEPDAGKKTQASKRYASIESIDSALGSLLILDTMQRKVFSYTPETGRFRALAETGLAPYSLSAGPDGRFLVSSYHYTGALAEAVVTEYDARGRKTGRVWRGLYSARYFRDGIIGRSFDPRGAPHRDRIVYVPDNGQKKRNVKEDAAVEVLLGGTEQLLYAGVSAVDRDTIAFIAAKKGKRRLCLYRYQSGEVVTVRTDQDDDENLWRAMRSLKSAEGTLLFSYADEGGGMYRLAALPLREGQDESAVIFTGDDFSGGVFSPALLGATLYYKAAFSAGDALMRYPAPLSGLEGRRIPVRLVPWMEEELREAGRGPAEPAPLPAAVPALAPAQAAAPAPLPAEASPDPLPARPYHPILYMNPLKFWVPFPVLRLSNEDELRITGGGVLSVMIDAAEQNYVTLQAGYDAYTLMANLGLEWINYGLGFPLQLSAADTVEEDTSGLQYRRTDAAISGTLSTTMGVSAWTFSAVGGAGVSFFAPNLTGGSPYDWDYTQWNSVFLLGLSFSSLRRGAWQALGQGLRFNTYAIFAPPEAVPRVEALFDAAFEPFPLKISVYGIYDCLGMTLQGVSGIYGAPVAIASAPVEYPSPRGLALTWLAGAELKAALFAAEIQGNLSHLYFNRFFGTLSYRAALYDSAGLAQPVGTALWGGLALTQSAVLSLGMQVTTVAVTALPIKVTPRVWGALRLSGLDDGLGWDDFAWNFSFAFEY
ncbi:MAG: hypothetical protein LBR16_06170 [Treponema sp.]|nr:hypothetical protein [Treponema sp.]